MSRVSEALRRAGYQTADDVVSQSDGVPFVSAEDATEHVSEHVPPHSESETHYRHDELANVSPPQALTESVRRGTADDIRIQEVLRVLNRRRRLIVAVVCLALGAAVIYNSI